MTPSVDLPSVTVWAERDTPRLRYVLDWLLCERLQLGYRLTHDKSEAASTAYCIAYGFLEDVASIHASSLLWETGIQQQEIPTAEWQGLHALFYNEASPCDIQFDILAGIFYLLTRYEEYLPFTPDRHARYPATQSILFSQLERPVLDEWVEALRIFLEQVWNLSIPRKPFSFRPTYDIDIAWSYRFKGLKRSIGAGLREAASMDWTQLSRRIRVLRQTEEDPYNSFIFLMGQHMMDEPRPIYFILAAQRPSPFDKNISPAHPRMSALIKALAGAAMVGLHPSYYSDKKPGLLLQEKAILERTTHRPVSHSRQHYIKLRFPQTYHALLDACIAEDWSMGYSTHVGFRAGTGSSFLWYDLSAERATPLRVHPFAFMDSTAHYDLGLSPIESFDRLRNIADKLRACGGKLVTIFHNYSLGTDLEWSGWRSEYERFLRDIKTTGNTA